MRTVLDCAATMAFVPALVVADSALARGLVTHDQLLLAARARSGPGRPRCLRIVRAADGRSESPFESVLRGVLVVRGVDGLELQVEIRLANGLRRVDPADVHLRIAIEADSFEHHGSREALVRDCERYDALTAAGWVVLRFTWEHVMRRPDWVADVVRGTQRRRLRP